MTTMIAEVYTALRAAQGVSEEQARAAAEAFHKDNTLATKAEVAALNAKIDLAVEKLQKEMAQQATRIVALLAGVIALATAIIKLA